MNICIKTLLAASLGVFCLNVVAQDARAIGEPVEDLLLKDVAYASFKNAHISDMRGKWLLLDFWSAGCTACVRSFPKLNELINRVKGNYQFLLVGQEHPMIRQTFEKYRTHYGLNLPIMYDSVLFNHFEIQRVPTLIIIDPSGKLNAVTTGEELTDSFFARLETGELGSLIPQLESVEDGKMPAPTILPPGAIRQSTLEKWERNKCPVSVSGCFVPPYLWSNFNKRGVEFYACDITALYKVAFLGKEYFLPEDSGRFGQVWPNIIFKGMPGTEIISDFKTGRNVYNYRLVFRDSSLTSPQMQRLMQKDLVNQLPYRAEMIKKRMPYYRLFISKKAAAKIASKGGAATYMMPKETAVGIRFKNQPVSMLINYIISYHSYGPPILDRTEIKGNIDVDITAAMTDFEDICKALRPLGFRFKKGKKKMSVLQMSRSQDPADSAFLSAGLHS